MLRVTVAAVLPVRLRFVPAPYLAGLARVELVVDEGQAADDTGGVAEGIGDLDWRSCTVCRVAVIEHVRVDDRALRGQPLRRNGYGTLLVRAVLATAPTFSWSTTVVTSAAAAAFWASVGSIDRHVPVYCPHMRADLGEVD